MKTPPRILHVITGINRGGAENHLLEVVRHQRAAGWAVSVAYLRGVGYWAKTFAEFGAEVHPLRLRFYGDAGPLLRLRRVIRAERFDLIHAHLPPAELYTRLALLGIAREALPLILSKHNEERFCKAPGQRVLGRWVARRAEKVIAISDAVNRYMAGAGLGVEAAKIETIRYGVDVAAPTLVREDGSGGPAADASRPRPLLRIGFVGRLVPQKDIPTLLRGFARFVSAFPDAELVVVGTGALATELRQLARDLGIAGRIVFTGFRDDIAALMETFDVFALTSVFEGLGLVLLEAMLARLPVVATRVGAIPEVVLDGETGLLVAARAPEELAAAFQKLTDATLRARLGATGHDRVRREFALARMCAQIDGLYARVMRDGIQTTKEAIPCAASTAN